MKQSVKNVGLAAATMAAAAGAYYLYGSKDAAKNRRAVSTWMRRAEREIVHEAKKLKNAAFTEDNYRRVISGVAQRYQQLQNVDPADVQKFVSAVQKSWRQAGEAVKSRAEHTPTTLRRVKKGAQRAVKAIRRRRG